MTDWQVIDGNITAPKGFKASGITAGLKPSGAPDLALIYSDTEAIAAGVFTTSQVRAACVDYCRQRLQSKASARAVLVNAGQANAGTGKQGWDDAVECAELVGEALNLSSESVLLASTGVIGQRIKMDILRQGIPQLVSELSETGGDAASKSIITTDLVPKAIALETQIDGRPVRIGGISKGSGMIHPNMATMLANGLSILANNITAGIDSLGEHLSFVKRSSSLTIKGIEENFNADFAIEIKLAIDPQYSNIMGVEPDGLLNLRPDGSNWCFDVGVGQNNVITIPNSVSGINSPDTIKIIRSNNVVTLDVNGVSASKPVTQTYNTTNGLVIGNFNGFDGKLYGLKILTP
jgi:hypothetical protein